MESLVSSTLTTEFSQHVDSTTVDTSNFGASPVAYPNTDRGLPPNVRAPRTTSSSPPPYTAVELDFEARNWRAALQTVQYQRGHKDKKAMEDFLSRQESPQMARASVVDASKRAGKEYKPGVGGVLGKIEAFMKVGDVAMKGAPESVGLAWMGIRLCMHSIEADFATFQLFSGAASSIIGILISCRAYGKMYGGDGGQKGLPDFQELHQRVVDFIPGIYTDILEFSYKMSKHIGRNLGIRLLKGLLSNASNDFRGMIDGIRASEKQMREYAQTATNQLSVYYAETTLGKQDVSLENQQAMRADLDLIKGTLDSNAKMNEMISNQIKRLEEEKKDMKKKTPLDRARERYEENVKRLSPTKFSETSLERNKSRKEQGTCEWVFDLEEYKSWRTSAENEIIRIAGQGGMGKSILVSNVINRLQDELKDSDGEVLHYFICSAGDDATRLAGRIKDQCLYQLYECAQSQESAEILEKANGFVTDYLDSKAASKEKKVTNLTFEDAYPSLAILLEKKVYLVLDALDECIDRKDQQFLKKLNVMLSPPDHLGFRFKAMLCSRPEADIDDDLAGKTVIKVEDHNGPDLKSAARQRLNTLPGFSSAERAIACEAIVQKAKGYFRCVDPAIEFLKKPLQRPLEKALERLPVGLDDSYQQILRQTDPAYLDLLKTALRWSILGVREPTISEVMDEYSRAYEQADGSDTNPYDDLEDPTKPEETRRLIPDQIRAAGSSTFLEISGINVRVRHTTVSDFFLQSTNPADQPLDVPRNVCPDCESKNSNTMTWALSKKEGHLQMAIAIFKHLNSPLFLRRYLPKASTVIENDKDANGLDKGDSATSEPSEIKPLEANGSTTSLAQIEVATMGVNGTIDSTSQDQGLQAPSVNGDSNESKSDDAAATDAQASSSAVVTSTKEDLIATVQDHLTDDGSVYGDEDRVASPFEVAVSSADYYLGKEHQPVSSVRYELLHWPHHLKAAEELWTPEERATNAEWQGLWKLAVQFLCESPDVFLNWQERYMTTASGYTMDIGIPLNPLQVAAAFGLTGLCEVLIQHGQSATAETTDGRSALWFAAEHDFKLLKLLLEHGADPNASKDWQTPFSRMLWLNSKLDHVKLMLDRGADCKSKDEYGWTAIHWIAIGGSEPEVLELLLANGADINAIDSDGETGLHKVGWHRPLPIPLLKAFIENGADVNLSDKESQQPLYEVCLQEFMEGARLLLEHGADVEHADEAGITALHTAATNGNLEIVQLLVDKGASLIKQDKKQRTPFYFSCANNHLEAARYLLSAAHDQGHHDSIRQPMEDGRTPFSKACGRGNLEIVKMLLDHPDADIDVNSIEGVSKRTALHWAAYNGRIEVAQLLLARGADGTIADVNGKTPLGLTSNGWLKDKTLQREPLILALIEIDPRSACQDADLMAIAAMRGSAAVIDKLLDAKAHPNKQDEHGWTPLQLARQYGNKEAAAVLEKRGAVVGSKPTKWVTHHKEVKVSEDGLRLEYIVPAHDLDRSMVLANHPIPAGLERFYFEIEIDPNIGRDVDLIIGVGFATQPAHLDKMPGWYNAIAPTWAFHGDDAGLFNNSGSGSNRYHADKYGKGATVGCGIIFNEGVDGNIFFTRDGESLGIAFDKGVRGRLYPAVGMAEPVAISANWGDQVEGKPFKWAFANKGRFGLEDVKVKVKDEGADDVAPIKI